LKLHARSYTKSQSGAIVSGPPANDQLICFNLILLVESYGIDGPTGEWLRAFPYPSQSCPTHSLAPPTVAFGTHITKTSSFTTRRARSPRHSSTRTLSLSTEFEEANLFKAHKVSAQTPITLLHVVSFAFLAVVLVSDYDIACMAPRLIEVI
jgi:hypothetical protein